MRHPASALRTLNMQLGLAPESDLTRLAARLSEGGKGYDLHKARVLGVNFKLKDFTRNPAHPVFVEDEAVRGADWADDPAQPLAEGEAWNRGRRATASGQSYDMTEGKIPQNPYMRTGFKGRGVLGQYGPNHAVDNGILLVKPDEKGVPTLYALGILRKFDGDAPAFAGGFAKFTKQDDGAYALDRDAIVDTKTEELFEEMISGSVPLQSPYADRLEAEAAAEIAKRTAANDGQEIRKELQHEIREQIETGLKMEQVKDRDPAFWQRLRDLVSKGREAYAGPVLNDNRSTDNAWIETRLDWFMLDDDIWQKVRGDNPAYDYRFEAGDDASGVVAHRVDETLARDAFASHGPMFAWLAAAYVLDQQKKGQTIEPSIKTQLTEMADFLQKYTPDAPKADRRNKANPGL
ncbi:MAG: hypothetical protein Alpg2KO_27840 [Alphaproteobacteria bacterium]